MTHLDNLQENLRAHLEGIEKLRAELRTYVDKAEAEIKARVLHTNTLRAEIDVHETAALSERPVPFTAHDGLAASTVQANTAAAPAADAARGVTTGGGAKVA